MTIINKFQQYSIIFTEIASVAKFRSISLAFTLCWLIPVFAFSQEAALDSLTHALESAKGTNRVHIFNDICSTCRFSDPARAMEAGNEGLALAQRIGDQKNEVYLRNNVGLLYMDKGQYDKALNCFIAVGKLADSIDLKEALAMSLQNSGIVYQYQELYEKALYNNTAALKLFEELGNKRAVASTLTTFGALYYSLEDNDKALEYFLRSLDIMVELGDTKGIADGLNNTAVIYEEMKNFPQAMEYHKKSLNINRSRKDARAISSSLYNIALIYKSQHDLDNAIKYIDSAIVIAKKEGALEHLREHYATLSEIYYTKNDFKKSLQYYTELSGIKDTLLNQDRNKLIVEMSTKYETEKKEKENEILKQQNDLQNLSINRQKIINYSVTVVLLLVLGLAFFIFKGYKQKQKANLQLEEKNLLIQEKNKIVEEKNKDITDSIRYAKRLQTAILKPSQALPNYFEDGFILFRPKDIVSGDFYWFEKFGNLSLVAAADCTGHGVPGAFMSIIGCNLLSQAVNEYAITQPPAILNSINKGLTKVLQQKGDADSFVTDGMDIALVSFDPEKMMVEYSGAFNPMWLIRNGEVHEFAADKFPVGAFVDSQVRQFASHKVPVQKGDMIYLFSDGFADQFGGPLGKKFKYKPFQRILLDHYTRPGNEQSAALTLAFEKWMGRLEQIDDVLVIGIRI